MRPIELDGLTAEPRVASHGEFKYQSYVYRGDQLHGRDECCRESVLAADQTDRQRRERAAARQGRVSLAMSAGEFARVRGTDREVRPTARPVSGPLTTMHLRCRVLPAA
jgi:hypothetical protein